MSSTKRKHSGGWQERNRVNKSNPKNKYCDHCRFWKCFACDNPNGCKYKEPREYYHRCKNFEWKENIIDTSEEATE